MRFGDHAGGNSGNQQDRKAGGQRRAVIADQQRRHQRQQRERPAARHQIEFGKAHVMLLSEVRAAFKGTQKGAGRLDRHPAL